MTKQELHTAFSKWIVEKGYIALNHRAGVYIHESDANDEIEIGQLKEPFLSHLENLLQDYE